MSFQNGMLNLTNWLGNVIMPTIAGLFAAAGIYRFGKAQPWQHFAWAGLASLMCSGLLRVLESVSNQAAWNNPDRYWLAVLTLVDWVGNVLLPLYAYSAACGYRFRGDVDKDSGRMWIRIPGM
ncbi:MAG: hypothetical protein WCA20_28950 [Candidatus Sulfotelmatobacter sp.]